MNNKVVLTIILLLVLCMQTVKTYGQTNSVTVGQTVTLDVPSVSMGYVDKAIWACSNPAIQFIEKSTFQAKVKVIAAFEGHATVELVYVEKYIDNKGFTRQNTYSKNFYISCKGGNSGSDSSSKRSTGISVQPELRVKLGNTGRIYYQLYPEGSSVDLFSNISSCSFFKSASFHKVEGYLEGYGHKTGIEKVKIFFYKTDGGDEDVSGECKVIVYDPLWVDPQGVSLKNIVVLKVGENDKKIFPIFTPANATALYDWDSDNPSVVYKAWTGCFVGKSVGIANMKLITQNNLTAWCTVVVLPKDIKMPGLDKALERTAMMLNTAEYETVK